MSPKIEFGTSGCREKKDFFTDEIVMQIGWGVKKFLSSTVKPDNSKVVIGYDTRSKSKHIAETLADVVGTDFTVEMSSRSSPTPAVSYYCKENTDVIFGLSATASHNPAGYNGIKLISEDGSDASVDTTRRIESLIPDERPVIEDSVVADTFNIVQFYIDGVTGDFDGSLNELNVVYDAVNGAGSDVLGPILESKGAEVRSIRSTPNKGLRGVEPNPSVASREEIRKNMEWADIGFMFDGDADRVKVFTDEGTVNSSELLALLYEYLLDSGNLGDAVRTVGAGSTIDQIAEENSRTVYESKIGFKHIAEKIAETDSVFGGDQTDGYCQPQHIPNKDGIYTAITACYAECEETLVQRLERIREVYGRRFADRTSVECDEIIKSNIMTRIEPDDFLVDGNEPDRLVNIDGFKMYFNQDWLLVRPSGTEPKIRLYAESNSSERTRKLLSIGRRSIEKKINQLS